MSAQYDVACPDCGTREAAGAYCTACGHQYAEGDWIPHSDPRAAHYRDTPRVPVRNPANTPVSPASGPGVHPAPDRAPRAFDAPVMATPELGL
jgi:hypothetical protein